MDFSFDYLLNSDEDEDVIEILEHQRRLYTIWERVDNFEKWDDHDLRHGFECKRKLFYQY